MLRAHDEMGNSAPPSTAATTWTGQAVANGWGPPAALAGGGGGRGWDREPVSRYVCSLLHGVGTEPEKDILAVSTGPGKMVEFRGRRAVNWGEKQVA